MSRKWTQQFFIGNTDQTGMISYITQNINTRKTSLSFKSHNTFLHQVNMQLKPIAFITVQYICVSIHNHGYQCNNESTNPQLPRLTIT